MREIEIVKRDKNYTIGNIGAFENLKEYSYLHSKVDMAIPGKVFLGEKLDMSSMEISFHLLKAGQGIPFDHMHNENEEVYVVIKGKGEFIIEDEVTAVKEGSIIKIEPEGKRRWRNNSQEDFIVMVIQAVSKSLNKFNVTDGYM
ncbi:cupin domain-containing protein [Clostridium sp. LP20]|uniref:cupin domain-containing protein n=1 Tax=Clostridium sp. LP20 TaxID=3418665 RepID=UPI003EE617C7